MRLSFATLIAFTVSLNTLVYAQYQEDIFERDVMDLYNIGLEQRDILSIVSTREIVRELERRGPGGKSKPRPPGPVPVPQYETCHNCGSTTIPQGTLATHRANCGGFSQPLHRRHH
ncbi:hypothetical protein DFP72DRAFT_851456 [Ephemerocybe angulata]|uniref:Uncharacterized protein n=1 Tax=Ephemerocybe angulata TaxID=980116 RepID=A0A8H6HP97_9AGAR|nr:hypothetical protein DFP72DRAFT_851456 [Tulosesus angulatus]